MENELEDPKTERELVISRHMNFPRELVWGALTEPEHVNAWWGPDGFKNTDVQMDLRVGGTWRFNMIGPDGTVYPNHCLFKEIKAPEKLVFDHGDGKSIWFESTITLEEQGGGTRITLRSLFPTKASRDEVAKISGAVEGGKQTLAKLETYIKEEMS